MFKEFFISFYFQVLKKRLHRMRLGFFIELNEFKSLIQDNSSGYTLGGYLENIMNSFTQIISLINKIEGVEKYMEKGNIFDNNFYALQIYKDILDIIFSIEKQLNTNLIDLKSVIDNPIKSNSVSLLKNIDIQNNRINILIIEMEDALIKMRDIIKKLNTNIIKYTTTGAL